MSFQQGSLDIILEPGENTLEDINFTGGFPTSRDLAPSILFIVLYALTLPVLIWRIVSPQYRSLLLLRPAMFFTCRMTSLIIRAIMSKVSSYSLGLLVAELVLISVGYLFLIEPVIIAWKRLISAQYHSSSSRHPPTWLNAVKNGLLVALISTIVIFVVSGIVSSQSPAHPNLLQVVRILREISYILSLGISSLLLVLVIVTGKVFKLPVIRTAFLVSLAAGMVTTGAYRVAQTYSVNPDSPARSLAAFWVLQISVEYVIYTLFLTISLPKWFPAGKEEVDTAGVCNNDLEIGLVNHRATVSQEVKLRKRPWYLKGPVTRFLVRDRYQD
ncbi:hypothetical protein BD324DRAFT_684197 [Kockovaella imperatae]|uniref:Uncharacterized protein n=1 Tax=Kockovaella imperatae TaxID=4999 RepID=A0A1Y1U629_9TREE|nr:hypothetical protein BD324DRAFT_684197 [Kockovaella imperatae]ORX33490.1 hypothetical protein BD324DRAFT_684197 [Kockovaella imperatae]